MAWRPPIMKHRPTSRRRRSSTRSVLRLLDLEHSKTAVLNSLTSQDAQRGYRHAIDEFVDWYCSESRLAFNRIVVMRYRSHLESRQLAPGTVNLRLGAVRRLAYEAADCGLLSSDLAAGIRRVKDRALLAVLLACGLRRHEAVELNLGHIQQREDHWAIVDLKGKGGHTRTIPDVGMGEECRRPVDPGSEHYIGQVVSSGAQDGENLGREADGKGGLACGSGVCPQQVSAARSPPNLCTTLLRRRRRTGANPVSGWSRFDSDHRTISRLQTADSRCRQRQNRNRTPGMTESSLSGLRTMQN